MSNFDNIFIPSDCTCSIFDDNYLQIKTPYQYPYCTIWERHPDINFYHDEFINIFITEDEDDLLLTDLQYTIYYRWDNQIPYKDKWDYIDTILSIYNVEAPKGSIIKRVSLSCYEVSRGIDDLCQAIIHLMTGSPYPI